MRRTLLYAALIACLLITPMAQRGSAIPAPTGSALAGPGRDPDGGGESPFQLFTNISFPSRTPSAEDWYGQGFALTSAERYSEAVTAYERALAANRSLLNAWYYLGDALFRLGRPHDALLALGNATAVDPDFVDAYFYEALIYRQLGLHQEEKEALGRGLEAVDRREVKETTRDTPGVPGSIPAGIPPGIPLLATGIALSGLAFRQRNRGS
jgi:tetratricopeptide (TPR) repeat protein